MRSEYLRPVKRAAVVVVVWMEKEILQGRYDWLIWMTVGLRVMPVQ